MLITNKVADQRDYQRRIKNMIFIIVFTRSNIYLALSKLSQYINNPAKYYKTAVKHILRYLHFNSDLYIHYRLTQKDYFYLKIELYLKRADNNDLFRLQQPRLNT